MIDAGLSINNPVVYPWHESDWKQLSDQHNQRRMHHALLFTGKSGLGKRGFGRHLAAYILCQQSEKNEPCGQCKGCLLREAGTHPDLLIIAPEEKGRFIKIDLIRRANDLLSKTSQMNGYKIVIINDADALNISAANALLKNLEEPASRTLFVLISDQVGRVPATVRSRCYKVELTTPDEQQTKSWLNSVSSLDTSQLDLVLALSDRAPLLARNIIEEGGLEARQQVIKGLVMLNKNKLSAIEVAQQWQKLDLLVILDWILLWTTDLIKFSMSKDECALKNLDMQVFLSKIVHLILVDELYLYMDKVQKLRQALLLGHNPNKALLLESILLDWRKCFK